MNFLDRIKERAKSDKKNCPDDFLCKEYHRGNDYFLTRNGKKGKKSKCFFILIFAQTEKRSERDEFLVESGQEFGCGTEWDMVW